MKKYCSDCKPNQQFDSYEDYREHLKELSVYEGSYHTQLGKWEVKAGSNCVLDLREIDDWNEQELKDNPMGEYPRCSLTGKNLSPGDVFYHYTHDVYSEERERTMRLGSVLISEEAKKQLENVSQNKSLASLKEKNAEV